MTAWLVRAGRNGERDQFALGENVVGGGFNEVADLTGAHSREDVQELVKSAYPSDPPGKISNFTGQLWAFRNRMEGGDLTVLPVKTTSQLAIGRISGPYEYRAGEAPDRRHLRSIKWLRTDIPRTAARQDLLHSLGAFMTICELKRNDAAWRLEQLAAGGQDPGARPEAVPVDPAESDGTVEDTEGLLDLERYARDRLTSVIAERFSGHKLASLVAAVLQAEGFICEVSEPGPDGGIDVLAGRGSLGLDPPRLVVQVKSSPTPVDAPTVRQLNGVVTTQGADQGLLVAWGGINGAARRELANQRFSVRVWNADNLIDAICRIYDDLPEETRGELPLKQIWAHVEEPAG